MDASGTNVGKTRFGCSLDDNGYVFDGYLTDEQDVGAKGATSNKNYTVNEAKYMTSYCENNKRETTTTTRKNIRNCMGFQMRKYFYTCVKNIYSLACARSPSVPIYLVTYLVHHILFLILYKIFPFLLVHILAHAENGFYLPFSLSESKSHLENFFFAYHLLFFSVSEASLLYTPFLFVSIRLATMPTLHTSSMYGM